MGTVQSCIVLFIVMDNMTPCFASWKAALDLHDYYSTDPAAHLSNVSKAESASIVPRRVKYKLQNSDFGHLSYAQLKRLRDTQSYKKYVIEFVLHSILGN